MFGRIHFFVGANTNGDISSPLISLLNKHTLKYLISLMIMLQKEIIDKYLFYMSHKFNGIFALMCASEHEV